MFATSCTMDKVHPVTDNNQSCDSVPKSFAADVNPIFDQYCVSCHNSTDASGGYTFETYNDISQNIGICLKTMNHESGVVAMPYQDDPLSDSLIQIVECWLSDGALNN